MKRSKIYYTPGMISLLIVPVLFYIYQPTVKYETVLKIIVPAEDQSSSNISKFTRSTVYAALKGKKINTVYLDEHHTLNARKLDFIAQEALKLKFYNDTTQVIKVNFSYGSTYNEFIHVLNIMHKDHHKKYALLDNDFYIFGEDPPEPRTEQELIIYMNGNDVVEPKSENVKTWKEQLSEQINKFSALIANNTLLVSAFVLLIVIPVFLKLKKGI